MQDVNWPRDNAELAAQLARQRSRYDQLVRNMSDLLMLVEPDGKVCFCNRGSELPPGAAAYPAAGSNAMDCVADADRPAVAAALADVSSGQVAVREVLFHVADGAGGQRTIEGAFTPVIEDGQVVQVKFLGRDVTEQQRSAEALRRANESLTRQQADLQRDLGVASKIHASLLPPPLTGERVLIDLKHMPLMGLGGDYVHIHRDDPLRPTIVVFDVSGHGIASALVASRAHSAVYAIMHEGSGPPEMIRRLNRFIYESFSDLGIFMTLLGVELDLEAGTACWCGSGHPPALLRKADSGRIVQLESQHLPIGVVAENFLGEPTSRTRIDPGDVLWLYTDGLMELRAGDDEILGTRGLIRRVRKLGACQPRVGMAEHCLREMMAGCKAPEDDVTMVVAAMR